MQLWETHLHTSEISPCGQVTAARAVEMYIEAGYTGVVVTNHLNPYGFAPVKDLSWEEKINWFYHGYELVKEAAGDKLRVLFGAELGFCQNGNDYLGYGFTREWLLAHPDLFEWGAAKFHEVAQQEGFLFFQAHPFRNGMTVVNPCHLDGVETYNGNRRHDSRNDIAAMWAKKYNLLSVAGSDFHMEEDAACGGIYTERDVQTIGDFVAAVREGVTLKTTG